MIQSESNIHRDGFFKVGSNKGTEYNWLSIALCAKKGDAKAELTLYNETPELITQAEGLIADLQRWIIDQKVWLAQQPTTPAPAPGSVVRVESPDDEVPF